MTFIDGYPIHNPLKYSIFAPWLKGTKRQTLMNELDNTIKWVEDTIDFIAKQNTNEL